MSFLFWYVSFFGVFLQCSYQFPRDHGVVRLLVLSSDQQSKTQRHSICYHIKQRSSKSSQLRAMNRGLQHVTLFILYIIHPSIFWILNIRINAYICWSEHQITGKPGVDKSWRAVIFPHFAHHVIRISFSCCSVSCDFMAMNDVTC